LPELASSAVVVAFGTFLLDLASAVDASVGELVASAEASAEASVVAEAFVVVAVVMEHAWKF
jgi:hypothetical protein